MKFSARIVTALIGALLGTTMGGAQAADRGHYAPQGVEKKRDVAALPDGWRKQLSEGEVLTYELFRHGKVVYRDAATGTVAVRLENKVVRLVEQTREIVDILDAF